MRDYVNGLVIILDYRDVNVMEYLTAIDFTEVHSFITILVHGYGMRIKNIHAITSSKRLKAIVDILKKMFGPKMASRFQIHDDVKTLHEYVPKNILPSELGGEERSIVTLFEEWRDVLSNESNKQFFKEMSRAVSNESSRMKEKLSGMDLGLAGSFRSLSVD
ncbi:alpha-tocopherol transfer protein-like [Manduca sexta]|nr:alpha-tocopherol transfer protein-like [Manduca sexta]